MNLWITFAAAVSVLSGTPERLKASSDGIWENVGSLEAVKVEMPRFPFRLLDQGVTRGTVRVIIEVSPDGTVSDSLVTAYTHREFARATEEAVRHWIFTPARLFDQPVVNTVQLNLDFKAAGGVLVVERADDQLKFDSGRFTYAPTTVEDLDAPLQLREAIAPIYPEEWRDQGVTGSARIHFYVCEEGAVRVPTVEDADHPWLASIAIDAVKGWQFNPPTAKGKPVLVRARQTFSFGKNPSPRD